MSKDREIDPALEPVGGSDMSALPPPELCEYQTTFTDCVKDETEAHRISDIINAIALSYSRLYPLRRLDGITVAYDYDKALSDLDRGFGASQPLAATNKSYAMGVAMSPMVVRDGVIKTRIVINAHIAHALYSEDIDQKEFAYQAFCHEFAHVSHNEVLDAAFPGLLLKPFPDAYEEFLYQFSGMCFDEYFATKHSAFFENDLLDGYRGTLIAVCSDAENILVAARTQYLEDRDFNRLSEITHLEVKKLMTFSGYLLGQADGLGKDAYDGDGKLADALDRINLNSWFEDLRLCLRAIDDNYGSWSSPSEIFSVNRCVEEAARVHYVYSEPSPDFSEGSAWVNIKHPLTWRGISAA